MAFEIAFSEILEQRNHVVAEVFVQEFGWGMPGQCSIFRKGCRVLGGEFDFHRLAGVVPVVTP
jgi:hypothetical protein